MKTNFKFQKENNIQGTILKSVVAGVCILIISASVNGQNYLSEDGTFNNMVLAIFHPSDNFDTKASLSGTTSTYYAEVKEESLELENWMKNENYFATFNSMETESEQPLELESWMVEEMNFTAAAANFENESDAELHLESWMLNDNYFKNSLFEVETEKAMEVENWMLNSENFQVNEKTEKPMQLENWMIASNFWSK